MLPSRCVLCLAFALPQARLNADGDKYVRIAFAAGSPSASELSRRHGVHRNTIARTQKAFAMSWIDEQEQMLLAKLKDIMHSVRRGVPLLAVYDKLKFDLVSAKVLPQFTFRVRVGLRVLRLFPSVRQSKAIGLGFTQ